MHIYLSSGYLDMEKIINLPYTFILVVMARGTGKTYGALKEMKEIATPENQFILMRRSQDETDMLRTPDFMPYNKLNKDFGWSVGLTTINRHMSAINSEMVKNDKDVLVPSENSFVMGYMIALTAMGKIRGLDNPNIKYVVFDEFIPEEHFKKIKNEGGAILNAYETINRNRELEGLPPLKFIAMANSNQMKNPLFKELGLISVAEKMKNKKIETYFNKERSLALIIPQASPISAQKEETALYRLTGKTSNVARMALKNEFSFDDIGRVGSKNLTEYKPVVTVGELTLYEHKSSFEYYCTTKKMGSCETFTASDSDLLRFGRFYHFIWDAYIDNNIVFENYACQATFEYYCTGK